jgi:hypothetical protein
MALEQSITRGQEAGQPEELFMVLTELQEHQHGTIRQRADMAVRQVFRVGTVGVLLRVPIIPGQEIMEALFKIIMLMHNGDILRHQTVMIGYKADT